MNRQALDEIARERLEEIVNADDSTMQDSTPDIAEIGD